jgi:hypothetical protein
MDSMPLMSSPVPMLIISAGYLLLVTKLLPKIMDKREALDLTLITRCYNIFQVFCCIFFVYEYFRLGWTFPLTFDFNHVPLSGVEVFTKVLWANWILRIIELVETVFFILRKKNNQASFLHIYHHISSIIIIWLLEKYELSKI